MQLRHFLDLSDYSASELKSFINRAIEFKRLKKAGIAYEPLRQRMIGLIFDMTSTRTRIAFEAAMANLGGKSIFIAPSDIHLAKDKANPAAQDQGGETIEDTAKVLSQMLDAIVIRTFSAEKLTAFAKASTIPVINGMTSESHPCQLLADIQTFEELRGSIENKKVAFVGDGYNMCKTYIEAADLFNFNLHIACPKNHTPQSSILDASNNTTVCASPQQAVEDADLVVTDVWSSLGYEHERSQRIIDFRGYQVNKELLDHAKQEVLFMHCLPAKYGEEVPEDIFDDPRSVVWEEAGNRIYTQQAILEYLIPSSHRSTSATK